MFVPCNTVAEYRAHLNTDKLVVIDFWARWCRPCMNVKPLLQEISAPDAVLLEVNVDENEEIQQEWRVRVLPTFLFIRNRQEVGRLEGADLDSLREKIATL